MSPTSLDYIRWAREQRAQRRLPRSEGDALQTLATYAGPSGECEASVKAIAKALGVSRQHTHELLSALHDRGLVTTQRRVGKPAVRRLRIDAPHHDQLSLDAPPEPENVSPAGHSNVSRGCVNRVASGGDTKDQEGIEEEDARDQRPSLTGVTATLLDVLAIMRDEPRLLIEDLAVNSVLAAFPEEKGHDHRQAAHVIVSWVRDPRGGPGNLAANALLRSELIRQGERRLRITAAAEARRAPAPPPGAAPAGKPWAGALRRHREAAGR